MTPSTASTSVTFGPFEQLRFAREIIQLESAALARLSASLDESFCQAVDELAGCTGSVLVIGMGKAGLVGRKIAATLASTGTPSHFLHPAEAIHGDLGRIQANDVLLMLSFSGETEEIVRLLPPIKELGNRLVAITGKVSSSLAQAASATIDLGPLREACPLGLAPSTSTTAMSAVGDALALLLSRMQQFQAEDFARFHPGGSLGRKLAKVEDVMRPLASCRLADESSSVRQVFVSQSRPGRRTGAIMLTNQDGLLTGLFTDSDLARLFEARREVNLDCPVRDVMTFEPTTITLGSRFTEAVELLAEKKISELPVVDHAGRPVGLIDITDVVADQPAATEEPSRQSTPAAPDTVPFPNKNGDPRR